MKNNKVECPNCLGSKEIMVPKLTKGFEYKTCSLCHGEGMVSQEIAEDYIFDMSGEEDFSESNDDW